MKKVLHFSLLYCTEVEEKVAAKETKRKEGVASKAGEKEVEEGISSLHQPSPTLPHLLTGHYASLTQPMYCYKIECIK